VGSRFIDRFQVHQALKDDDISISYLVLDEKKGESRILREIFPSDPSSRPLMLRFDQAASTLIHSAPSHLMPVMERFVKFHRFYTVEKYQAGKSVREEVLDSGPFDEKQGRLIFEHLLQAIKALHGMSPGFYHGRLDAAKILLTNNDQVLLLTDPGYLLDSAAGLEYKSDADLVAKDLRDSALAVLELISGSLAEALQEDSDRIAQAIGGISDPFLSSALEWLLTGRKGKPSSLEGVERLQAIVREAEAEQDSGNLTKSHQLFDQAYNLCGADALRGALDKVKSKEKAEAKKTSPPDGKAETKSTTAPAPTAPVEKKPSSEPPPAEAEKPPLPQPDVQPDTKVRREPLPSQGESKKPPAPAPPFRKMPVLAALSVIVGLVLVFLIFILIFLTIRNNEKSTTATLPPPPVYGSLMVQFDQPANASLDDWDLPQGGQRLAASHLFKDIRAGTHTLDVWKDGYRRQSFTVTIRGGQTTEFRVTLQR
jgi:serine/threonine protein kinase